MSKKYFDTLSLSYSQAFAGLTPAVASQDSLFRREIQSDSLLR